MHFCANATPTEQENQMLNTAASTALSPAPSRALFGARPNFARSAVGGASAVPTPCAGHPGPAIDMLAMLNDTLSPQRRVVHTGDVVYRGGQRFDCLYILNSGVFKIVNQSSDEIGRAHV